MEIRPETRQKIGFTLSAAGLGLGALLLMLHRKKPAYTAFGVGAVAGLATLVSRVWVQKPESPESTGKPESVKQSPEKVKAAKETRDFLRSLLVKDSRVKRRTAISDDQLNQILDTITADNFSNVKTDWNQFVKDINLRMKAGPKIEKEYALFGKRIKLRINHRGSHRSPGVVFVASLSDQPDPLMRFVVARVLVQLERQRDCVTFSHRLSSERIVATITCPTPLNTLTHVYKTCVSRQMSVKADSSQLKAYYEEAKWLMGALGVFPDVDQEIEEFLNNSIPGFNEVTEFLNDMPDGNGGINVELWNVEYHIEVRAIHDRHLVEIDLDKKMSPLQRIVMFAVLNGVSSHPMTCREVEEGCAWTVECSPEVQFSQLTR